MRLIFALLIVANAAFFVLASGMVGRYLPDGREPDRVNEQIAPDRVRLLTGDAQPTKAAAAPVKNVVACVELGGFSGEEVKRVEGQIESLGIAPRVSVRKTDEQASFIVYLPPFSTRAAAEAATAELRRIGINDSYVIQDAGPYKNAISLGVFRTDEAAKAELTTLSQLGVKNAKSGARASTVARSYYQVHTVDPDLMAKLNDLRSQYPGEDVHDCPAGVATTALSSSGT